MGIPKDNIIRFADNQWSLLIKKWKKLSEVFFGKFLRAICFVNYRIFSPEGIFCHPTESLLFTELTKIQQQPWTSKRILSRQEGDDLKQTLMKDPPEGHKRLKKNKKWRSSAFCHFQLSHCTVLLSPLYPPSFSQAHVSCLIPLRKMNKTNKFWLFWLKTSSCLHLTRMFSEANS